MGSQIVIRGAKQNNLKGIDLTIPKEKLVVFTGVSGSGKSSVVFDTIAAEAVRQLRDTFPSYLRNRMPQYDAPDAEYIDFLSTAIVVGQKSVVTNARSTVGTLTDIAPLMRLLYSRCASPTAGTSNCYSFNDPQGMCTRCGGLGKVVTFDLSRIIDRDKSLSDGAIQFPGHQVGSCLWQVYANSGLYDPDKKMKDFTQKEWNDFLHGSGITVTIQNTTGKVWGNSYKQTYEGFQDRIERLYLQRDVGSSGQAKRIITEFTKTETCPVCFGKRLNQRALNSKLQGYSIADLGQMEITDVIEILKGISDPVGKEMSKKILAQLQNLMDMGLGYLSLDRPSDSLSGGELQRLKLLKHLGSSLVGLIYIFDEPSIGLHPLDVDRLKRLLVRLRDRGNTVLVVEHNEAIIRIADHIVEMGPLAGNNGGQVVFQGSLPELLEADTLMAKYLKRKKTVKTQYRSPSGYLELHNAVLHNLKNVSVRIPMSCMTAVTGVAGAGKSSLICGELLRQHPEAVHIDQSPIGTSSRSTPATYTGIMDEIRKLMGKANHVSAQYFSYNSKGACPVCKGKGVVSTDMAFMDPVDIVCEACKGKRYSEQALSYLYRGKNVLQIMSMTVDEAADFFKDIPKIAKKLAQLQQVGMGYITLGQPTSTLSGGECQRIKLASNLKEHGKIYIMDEPTAGLHQYDIDILLGLFRKILDQGNTLIVVEHNLNVIKQADWIIDMGPGGGKEGGEILFQGTPQQLLECSYSHTARYLRESI